MSSSSDDWEDKEEVDPAVIEALQTWSENRQRYLNYLREQ